MNPNIVTALIGTAGLVLGALVNGFFNERKEARASQSGDKVAMWDELRKDNAALSQRLDKCYERITKLEETVEEQKTQIHSELEVRIRAEMAVRACLPLYEAAVSGVLPDKRYVEDAARELRKAGFLAVIITP